MTFLTLFKRWAPVVLWAGFIFSLSAQPDLASPFPSLADTILRKAAHVGEYAVLGFLIARAVRPSVAVRTTPVLLLTVVLCVLYAISDEVHQVFVPGRVGSLRDVSIDGIGSVLGAVGFVIRRRKIS